MPSRNVRREFDSRQGRFESEVRVSDMQRPGFTQVRKYQCCKCLKMFEERSRHCPRCDALTMGELKPIDSQHVEEARRKAIDRARRGIVRRDE